VEVLRSKPTYHAKRAGNENQAGGARPSHARTAIASGEQIRFYAPDGRSIGTAAPLAGGSTRYFDSAGRSTGTSSTTAGGFTTFYDSRGHVIGREIAKPRDKGMAK